MELLLVLTSVLFIVDPFAAVPTFLLISFYVLAAASLVERRLGQTGMRILTRLMGLVLCAIAVQFIIDGIKLSGLVKAS